MNQPYRGALAVSKSDETVFACETRGIYVGGTGDIAVTMFDGSAITIESIPAGFLLPISVTQVLETGTTATEIVAFF